MAKVLIALTSFSGPFWGSKNTGVYWSEMAHTFEVLDAAGFDVQFVSETGAAALDEGSIPSKALLVAPASMKPFASGNDAKSAWFMYDDASPLRSWQDRVQRAADVLPRVYEYSGIYFIGGHGTVFDFPTATSLQQLASERREAA
jgi:D-lactate dehydratase